MILAGGASLRFGSAKLTARIGARSLLDRALDATRGFPVVVVAAPGLVTRVLPTGARTIVVNAQPQEGMSRSLQLAHALVAADRPIAVLLADMPFVDAAIVARVAAAYAGDVDIVDPRIGGIPAHPVIFGPAARARIPMLPAGDSLRELRGGSGLRIRLVELEDLGAVLDVDVPGDLEQARAAESSPGTIGPAPKL